MSALPDAVTTLECPNGSRVFLVGTAHFSTTSVADVRKTINMIQPHAVVLELCRERQTLLKISEETIRQQSREMNLEKIRMYMQREGTVAGLTQAIFIKLSSKLMDKLGIVPGGEFRAGFEEGLKIGSTVLLGDRQIKITFKRALNSLPLWQQFRFIRLLATSLAFDVDITLEEIEKMKNIDMVQMFIGELSTQLPAISKVFVDERDQYLTHSLMTAANCVQPSYGPPVRVVGVVGMGHVTGIKKLWLSEQCQDITALVRIPDPHWSTVAFWAYFRWGIQSLLTFGFVWLGVRSVKFIYRNVLLLPRFMHYMI